MKGFSLTFIFIFLFWGKIIFFGDIAHENELEFGFTFGCKCKVAH